MNLVNDNDYFNKYVFLIVWERLKDKKYENGLNVVVNNYEYKKYLIHKLFCNLYYHYELICSHLFDIFENSYTLCQWLFELTLELKGESIFKSISFK